MLPALRPWLESLLFIGARPSDTAELRLRKSALVLIAASITVLATIWTLTYLVLGLPLAAAIPFAYQVISVASLVYLARTGSFDTLRLVQIAAITVLPFMLQWALGGFENSSAMMIWAFTGPLMALVFFGARGAVVVFVGYLGLILVSFAIDARLAATAPALPDELQLAFYALNIAGVSATTFATLLFFVRALERERERSERLLHNVLPPAIAERLKAGDQTIADDHAAVTVLFADIAGFSGVARREAASDVIALLNRVFTAFDELAERHGLEKIKTIGDAYMAAAGAPVAMPDHAAAAADMALDMLVVTAECAKQAQLPLQLRVGIHSGPAIAGVIGRRKFAYDLWGDAVNVASRMESHGLPGRIQVSDAVRDALDGRYRFEERGLIEIKGLGEMRTWLLLGRA